MSFAWLILSPLGCAPGDTLPEPARLTLLPFEAVADSLNTYDEDGLTMSWVAGVQVAGLAENGEVAVTLPAEPGVDRRDMRCLKWNVATRRWDEVTGVRVRASGARELGAVEVELAAQDGLYGVFTERKDGGAHGLVFRDLAPGVTEPEWRVVQPHARVVLEGRGERVLALEELPPDTRLTVQYRALSGLQRHDATLWQWCQHGNRRLDKGQYDLEISFHPDVLLNLPHHD